jgi:PPOX class probable F420-dependent enzyme
MQPLSEQQRAFLQAQRVGRLATADSTGMPHVVPVCYACAADGSAVYIVLDTKPKRVPPHKLKRARNVLQNPQAALVVDHYSEDWDALTFVMLRGPAALLAPEDAEQPQAIALLRARYAQYRAMPIEEQPVIVLRPARVVAWGALPQA